MSDVKIQDRFYRCSCGDSHWLNIHCYEPFDGYPVVSIVETWCGEPSLIERIKSAWKMLRNQQHIAAEVILSPEKLDMLVDGLREARGWAEEVERKASDDGDGWAKDAVAEEKQREKAHQQVM